MSDHKGQYGYNEFGVSDYGGAVTVSESPSTTTTVTQTIGPQSQSTESSSIVTSTGTSVNTNIGSPESGSIVDTIGFKNLESADGYQSESGSLAITIGGPGSIIDIASSTDSGKTTVNSPIRLTDVAAIAELAETNEAIVGTISVLPVDESIPLFELPQISVTPITDIYNQIYISESPQTTFISTTITNSNTSSHEQLVRIGTSGFSTEDSTSSADSGTIELAYQLLLKDAARSTDTGGFTITSSQSAYEESLMYTDAVVSIWNGTQTVETAKSADEPSVIVSVPQVALTYGYGVADTIETSFPRTIRNSDRTTAFDSGNYTKYFSVTTDHTTTAQPVVSMPASVLQYSTGTADADDSARFSNPFDPRVGEYGSAYNSAQSLFPRDFGFRPESIAGENDLVATNNAYSDHSGESTTSFDSPTITERVTNQILPITFVIEEASIDDSAIYTVSDSGDARDGSDYYGGLVRLSSTFDPTANTVTKSSESGASSTGTLMLATTSGFGSDQADAVIEHTSIVLEGSAGVQTEILTHYIRTIGEMRADGSSYSANTASSTNPSTKTMRDEGVATNTEMGVSESVVFSEDDSGSATDTPSTSQPTTLRLNDYSVVVEIPETTTTSRSVVLDEFASVEEFVSAVTPNLYSVGDIATARNQSTMTNTGRARFGTIERVPVTDTLSVVQQNTSLLRDERGLVSPELGLTPPVSHSLADTASAIDSGGLTVPAIIWSTTTIPGLRRTQDILGFEKDFIYSREVGARRDVEVGEATDGSVEIGPLKEVRITVPLDRDAEIGPTRSIEISSSDE